MKIIGIGKNDKFIVEIEKNEILSITGCDHESQLPTTRAGRGPFFVDAEFQVSVIYRRLREMRLHKASLGQASASLRYFADLIAPVENLIQEAIAVPDPEKEEAP